MNAIPLSIFIGASLVIAADGQAPLKPPVFYMPPTPLQVVSSEDGPNPRVAEGLSPSVSNKLPECDRIVVFLLAGDFKRESAADRFPIPPYYGTSGVIASKALTGAEASKLCSLWRGLTFDNKGSVLCHSPAYGLRFYHTDKLVFETSVSFSCRNFYYIPSFPFRPGIYAWHGFRTNDDAGKGLVEFLKATLPDNTIKPKS